LICRAAFEKGNIAESPRTIVRGLSHISSDEENTMRVVAHGALGAVLLGGLTLLAQPQPSGSRTAAGGMRGISLLQTESVQAELHMTKEQASRLKTIAAAMSKKQSERLRDIPRDQLREKLGEVIAEINQEADKAIGTILKPEQLKRLDQIKFQSAGARAFSRSDVQSALKLTADQKDKIKDIQRAATRKSVDLLREFSFLFSTDNTGGKGINSITPPAPAKMKEYQKKTAAQRKDTLSKVMATLTDDQKAEWKKLIGKPFDVAKPHEERWSNIGQRMSQFRRDGEKKDE
jgi:hypothetical protein